MPGAGRPKKILKGSSQNKTLNSFWGVGESSRPTTATEATVTAACSRLTLRPSSETSELSDSGAILTREESEDNIAEKNPVEIGLSSTENSVMKGVKRKFKPEWKSKFSFLEYSENEGFMFCRPCRKNEPHPEESSNFFVKGTQNFRLSTILCHEKSKGHQETILGSCKTKIVNAADPLPASILKLSEKHKEKLIHIFNTVYYIITTHSSYSTFPKLCSLQEKNGIDLGISYTTHHKTVPHFAKYISDVFLKEAKAMIEQSECFSLILDGTTDRSSSSCEIAYITVLVDGKPTTKYLANLSPETGSAEHIFDCLNSYFETLGILNWKDKLTSLITDGASVYHGRKNGLIELIRNSKINKFLIGHHCLAHKMELQIKAAFSKNEKLEEFVDTLRDIFSLYHKSPKKIDALKEIAAQVQQIILKFGSLPKTRWISFSFKSVLAVERNWKPLVRHLKQLEKTSDSKVREKSKKILQKIEKSSFIATMAIMYDIYSQLSIFSQKLQTRNLLMYEAQDELENLINIIRCFKTEGGAKVKSITEELLVLPGQFREENIVFDLGDATSFLKECSNLCERVVTFLENMHGATKKVPHASILDPRTWPSKDDLNSFGNAEMEEIALFFRPVLNENEEIALRSEWLSYKRMVSSQVSTKIKNCPKDLYALTIETYNERYPVISKILSIISIIVPSSAEAERGFSQQNLLKTQHRSLISAAHLDHSLRICLKNISIKDFDPNPALSLWLLDTKRRPNQTKTRKHDELLSFSDED